MVWRWWACLASAGALLVTQHREAAVARRRSLALASLPASEVVADVESFCSSGASAKVAAVYAVFDKEGLAQYVGISRDVRSSLARHVAAEAAGSCESARLIRFEKASREAMGATRAEWIASLGSVPVGNADAASTWAKPPLSEAEAERKLKLRQAIADDGLRRDDPEAWSAVVRKAMKDGDFDGSELDRLDAQIAHDAAATARSEALRRAAGDWQREIADQSRDALRPDWQTARLEMYTAPGCPHCDRMRAALRGLGAYWTEFDVDLDHRDDDVARRAARARVETVPQLYVLRDPPLNGRPAEWLVGGADDLDRELLIPESTAFSFKGRISDPVFAT